MPSYINNFRAPDHIEQVYEDADRDMIGTLRIKPSGLAWKPKGQHKFYSVNLDAFADWITSDEVKAKRTKS